MVLNISKIINNNFFCYLLQISCRLSPFIEHKMEESLVLQAKNTLQRLNEAERRAKLLKCEIKSIKTQISILTERANSILTKQGLSVDTSNITENGVLKRTLEETDTADLSKRSKTDPPMENGYVLVYTDGACENNGKPNAKAGIGVWFADGHHLNISKPVKGRATNNTAEIQAPIEALKVLKNYGYSKVKIITDSQFTINCMTKWIHKWKSNQWKLAGGGPVKNKEDLVVLDNLCHEFQDIKWEHCAGHRGIKGNEEADKLAREGALHYSP